MSSADGYRPNVLALGLAQTRIELRQFFRNPQRVVFTFSLPLLLMILFAAIFDFKIDAPPGHESLPFRQYFVAGMIAAGIVSNTFTNLASVIAIEQHEGFLKRLSGTPLPKTSYFIGKIGLTTVASAAQTAIMLVVGVLFYGLHLPTDVMRWIVFALVFALGIASCSLLGIAYTRVIPNAAAAPAMVQPPYLILQFISGVFFVYSDLPKPLQVVAEIFPLKWMAQGLRYVFLPDWLQVKEQGGEWHVAWVVSVLAAWTVAAFVLAARTFRWSHEGE